MIPVRINSWDKTLRPTDLIPAETIARVAHSPSARSRSSHYQLANLGAVTSNVVLHTLTVLPRDEECESFKPELFISRPASPRVALGGVADRVRLQTWEAGEAAEPLPEPRRIRVGAGSPAPSEAAPDSRLGQALESPSSPAAPEAGTAAMHARLALADAASIMQLYAQVMGPGEEAPRPPLPRERD